MTTSSKPSPATGGAVRPAAAQPGSRAAGQPGRVKVRGSRAGDLFAGQQTRAREDVEIAVPATGFGAICEALDELEFELAGWGRLCRPSTAAPKDDADFAATAPRMTLGDLASG